MKLDLDLYSAYCHSSNDGFHFHFDEPPLPEATSGAVDGGGVSDPNHLNISIYCAHFFLTLNLF